MRYNEAKTRELLSRKTEIILRNGPVEELASDPALCFFRLLDAFCLDGPRDKGVVSGYRVVTELSRRSGAPMVEIPHGVILRLPHTEWKLSYALSGRPLSLWLTVPDRSWESQFFEPYNVGLMLAVDHFMPELQIQADILWTLARIRKAERDAAAPQGPAR